MLKSQILQFVDFLKTQKSKFLENETLYFLQIKKFINYTSRAILWQKNTFVAEVTYKWYVCGSERWQVTKESVIRLKSNDVKIDVKCYSRPKDRISD